MKTTLADFALVLVSFTAMEGVAWLAHKYLMHQWLWSLHKDHHRKEVYGFFEHNDFFFLIFAMPGVLCLAAGTYTAASWLFFIGLGITFYGICYFVVHDVFIHRRIKLFRNSDHWYFRAIRRAHKTHHKHLDKEGGECFGMLWVPLKYFHEARASRQ